MGWYRGTVNKVVNKDKFSVQVKWNEDCLGASDKRSSMVQLKSGNWNPKSARKNAWRQYID